MEFTEAESNVIDLIAEYQQYQEATIDEVCGYELCNWLICENFLFYCSCFRNLWTMMKISMKNMILMLNQVENIHTNRLIKLILYVLTSSSNFKQFKDKLFYP